MEQLSILESSAVAAPLIRTNDITADAWEDTRMPVHPRDGMQKRAFAALTMKKRIVKNDWSKVVLRVMIDAAQDAGVEFESIDSTKPEYALPVELRPLCDKAITSSKAARLGKSTPSFTVAETDLVAQSYIHCSANWNSIVLDSKRKPYGGTSVSEILSFVNRPDENWQRTTYNMDGNKR
jgi:hypothetical protein